VLASVRESGRIATCSSNLRQIGLATTLYANDNNDYYPPVGPFPVAPGLAGSWPNRIYPYVKSEAVFQCPSLPDGDFKLGGSPETVITSQTGEYWHNGSYVRNMLSLEGMFFGVRQSHLRHPSSTILLLDGKVGDFLVNPGKGPLNTVDDLTTAGLAKRHRDGVNVLMADGHAKWMKFENLLQRSLWTVRETS